MSAAVLRDCVPVSNLPPPGLINYPREVGTGVEGEERNVLVKSLVKAGDRVGAGLGRLERHHAHTARARLCAGFNPPLHLE